MSQIPAFPDAHKLAGGTPDKIMRACVIPKLTLWHKLQLLVGGRIVIKTTVVVKGLGMDMDWITIILPANDQRSANELADADPIAPGMKIFDTETF